LAAGLLATLAPAAARREVLRLAITCRVETRRGLAKVLGKPQAESSAEMAFAEEAKSK
jgi:hypothetical protein